MRGMGWTMQLALRACILIGFFIEWKVFKLLHEIQTYGYLHRGVTDVQSWRYTVQAHDLITHINNFKRHLTVFFHKWTQIWGKILHDPNTLFLFILCHVKSYTYQKLLLCPRFFVSPTFGISILCTINSQSVKFSWDKIRKLTCSL